MSTARFVSRCGWSAMSSPARRPIPADLVRSFAHEMAQLPDAPHMLERLRNGHESDQHGWCSHPTHAYRWERHPCATLRLADLVEGN